MDTRATMVKAALVLALTVMAAQAAAAPPIIASAELGAGGATLVLAGVNFAVSPTDIEDPGAGAQAPPGVSLALTPLPVTASSATSVTATLPATLAAGTYLVVLTRSDREMAVSYLTTRAVGPQGSAGVAGPAGPAGRKGMPGAVGPAGPAGPEAEFTPTADAEGNLAVGLEALHALTTGLANVALGRDALRGTTTGTLNVAVGGSALRSDDSYPVANTAVGFEAFANAGGFFHRGIAVGRGAGRDVAPRRNVIYVGHPGLADEAGVIRVGAPATHTHTHLPGTVTAPAFAGDGSALTNVRAVYQ